MHRTRPLLLSLLLVVALPASGQESRENLEKLKPVQKALNDRDFETARRLLLEEAEAGNPAAMFGLGEFYRTGQGGEVSASEAVRWYEKAAGQNHPRAHFRLGEFFLKGFGDTPGDQDRALFHLQAAAEAGYVPAWTTLGRIEESFGDDANAKPERDKHFTEARALYRRAAEKGELEASYRLGVLFQHGKGGEEDLAEAYKWVRRAAIRAYPEAMNLLGNYLKSGMGVQQDSVAAVGWFLSAADRGSIPATANLGVCYEHGIGVPKDYDKAGQWYAQAAQAGNAPAQLLLGRLFEEGKGTDPKPVFAYVNYARAAAKGNSAAIKARDALKEKLSAEELAQAEKLFAAETEEKPEN